MRLLREIPVKLLSLAMCVSVIPVVPAFASAPVPGNNPDIKVAKLLPLAPQLDYLEPADPPDKADNNYGSDTDSIDEAPDATKAILVRAVEKYSAGQMAEAAALFQRVLAVDANNADAHYNLGAIDEQQGKLSEALSHYQIAARHNPHDKDFSEAVRSVAEKMQMVKAETARRQVQQQQAISQKNGQMRQEAIDAKTAFQAGNFDLAIQKLNSLSNSNVKDPDVEFGLSQAYKAKSNLGQARYHLTNAMALDPNNETYKQAYASLNAEFKRGQEIADADLSLTPGDIVPINGNGTGRDEVMGRYKTQDRKKRLIKAVGASAAGAAIGAIMGGFTSKYDRRGGALRGAVYGGALGLMLGGFSGR